MKKYPNLVAALKSEFNASRIEFNNETEIMGVSCKFCFQKDGVMKYAKFMVYMNDSEKSVQDLIEKVKDEMK